MANLADSIQLTIEQTIVPTIHQSLWDLDPVYPMIARSSANVKRNEGIGRGYTVRKTWGGGLAGGAHFQSVGGPNVLSGPNQHILYDGMGSFESISEVSAPNFYQTTVDLIEHRGNFYLPHEYLRADRLRSSIGSVVAQNMKGVADLLALQESALWYSTDTTNYALVTLTDVSEQVVDVSTGVIDIYFADTGDEVNDRVHRFRPGLMVDCYTSSDVKINNGFYVTVDNVDPLAQKVTLRRNDGGVFAKANFNNDDGSYITLRASKGVAPSTLEGMIADGSTVSSFYGLDVSNYGQFKSYRVSNLGVPTETSWNKYLGYFWESFPGKKIDCAITTMGVLLAFIDNIDSWQKGGDTTDNSGRMRYDRQGKAVDMVAGWDAFKYRFGSRPVEIYTSTISAKGKTYFGHFKNGGLVRYVPPAIQGAKVDSRFGMEVEFIVPLTQSGGYQGIFKMAHNSVGGSTDFVEAPFVRRWNIMPSQPNFMVFSGQTELFAELGDDSP